jgi:hypothetical protein
MSLSTPWRYSYTGGAEVQLHSFLLSVLDGGDSYPHTPAALCPEKESRFPLNRRLVGSHSLSGRFVEDKNLLFKAGIESQIVQSVA